MESKSSVKLKLLAYKKYRGVNKQDPIRFYYWPIIGPMYKKRVELCLDECQKGQRVLEIGFGTGLSFLNLNDLYDEIHGLDLTASIPDVQALFEEEKIKTYLKNGDVLAMPYPDSYFDTVMLVSILEHLKPDQQITAFKEIFRVLKPGGQVVFGVPIERPLMVFIFRLMGVNIREHHYSTEKDVHTAASKVFEEKKVKYLAAGPSFLGNVYLIGHFTKPLVIQ